MSSVLASAMASSVAENPSCPRRDKRETSNAPSSGEDEGGTGADTRGAAVIPDVRGRYRVVRAAEVTTATCPLT